jgi:hypothetical protein
MEEHADAREMTVYRLTLGLGILKEMNSSLIVWKKWSSLSIATNYIQKKWS